MMRPSQQPADARPPLAFRRVIVKVGTNLLTNSTDRLDLQVMASLVGQIARLQRMGREVILVSSGAVAAGRHRLGEVRRVRHLPLRQVYAAVGQSLLMDAYDQLFRWHDITIAQTLLTRESVGQRLSYLNARNTLLALLDLGVVPVVNENDVVAVEELEDASFGDNDNLSALVATLADADALVLLTDQDGLYTADPRLDSSAQLIPFVARIDAAVEAQAGGAANERGTGGMVTKIEAAKLATAAGVAVIIANGHTDDILLKLAAGDPLGTLFLPAASKLEGRKRWMLTGRSRRGTIVVDGGAARALREQNRSLLPAGVHEAQGEFRRGDIVAIRDTEGQQVAYGIVNYGVDDVRTLKGLHSDQIEAALGHHYGDEVVHRDNLVLL